MKNRMKSTQKKNEKEFIVRNSLLTDLFENKHIETIYNSFLGIFLSFFMYSLIYNYLEHNELNFGLKLVRIGFGKFHVVILGWSTLLFLTFLVYCCFKLWIKYRNFNVKIIDWFCLILFSLYYIFTFKLAELIVTKWQLPVASSIIIAAEQCRFIMKIHSFIRTNSTKVLNNQPIFPKFSNFLYFLFAPTLLYRDSYPRTPQINWSFALMRILEILIAIWFLSFVAEKLLNPPLEAFCLRKYTIKEIILVVFQNVPSGTLINLVNFYVVLHSSQNFFAEILRFGDRKFYSDWWTSTDFATFFRKWNIIVQDWLYCYIYLDFIYFFKMSETYAKLSLFIISDIVHEWFLTFGFGFFFPLLSFEFLFLGVPLSKVKFSKNSFFNSLFLYMLMIGMSSLVTLYTVEYYARNNAPIKNPTFWEQIIPRFATADCLE